MSTRKLILAMLAACSMSGCGFYPFGEDENPSATKPQIVEFLADCDIHNAKILPGQANTTDWVIDFETVERSKWDCLEQHQQDAGVMAQTQATKVLESS